MKTVVIGSDDVINIHLQSSSTGKAIDLSPYFQAGGDVICSFQNADGLTASELSFSATGGAFPGTVVPDGPSGAAGDFHINVPRQASSAWMANDAANIEIILQSTTGKRLKENLIGVIAIVADSVVGTM